MISPLIADRVGVVSDVPASSPAAPLREANARLRESLAAKDAEAEAREEELAGLRSAYARLELRVAELERRPGMDGQHGLGHIAVEGADRCPAAVQG